MKLDMVAGDHVGAGPLGFRQLPFKLARKPQVIVIKHGNPFTFGVLDSLVARNLRRCQYRVRNIGRRMSPRRPILLSARSHVCARTLARASASMSGRLCVGTTTETSGNAAVWVFIDCTPPLYITQHCSCQILDMQYARA